MGYVKDCGTGIVHEVDKATGCPKDKYGHLLNPVDWRTGEERSWKIGDERLNLTSPYGFLNFACGTGDDFHCFDWNEISTDKGKFVILHAVINSETGCFIEDGDYQVMPANTEQEKRAVLRAAFFMLDQAYEWLYAGDDGDDHDEEGWNQRPSFFVADIAGSLFGMEFKDARHLSAEEKDRLLELAYRRDEEN